MRVSTITAAILVSLMPPLAATANPGLVAVAESSSMIWNAVAVLDKDIYVAGPRWTGSKGPAVARLDAQGHPIPYPDAAWNDWREGADPTKSFVNVNAIHSDGRGSLWIVDANGDLYFSDLATNALKVRTADGGGTTLVRDGRLHWIDAPFIDDQHDIWLPVPQLDRTAIFHGGKSEVQWPIALYRFALPRTP